MITYTQLEEQAAAFCHFEKLPNGHGGLKRAKQFLQVRPKEAIAFVAARPDTRWWHELTRDAAVVCFITGRVRFPGEKSGAPFPSALIYYGQNAHGFVKTLGHLGEMRARLRDVDI